MPHFSARGVIAAGLAGTMAIAVPMAIAAGTSNAQPANKAVAAGSHTAILDPLAQTPTPILTASIKTSKPEDLLLNVSLECSILTDIMVGGNGANTDTQSARGGIRVWIEVDGHVVPIEDTSAPPQDPNASGHGNALTDGVTFCDRYHQRTITDAEGDNKTDSERDYELTKTANAFNWVRLNTGSGTHAVIVYAQFYNAAQGDEPTAAPADATATYGNTNGGHSAGYIGKRTLVIEPTKLANNADTSSTNP